MKKIFLILILTIIGSVSIHGNAQSQGTDKEAIRQAIEKKISGMNIDSLPSNQLKDSIVESVLNDTILNTNKGLDDNNYALTFYTDADDPKNEVIISSVAIVTPFLTIIAIVIACLIVSYKKRKRKYAMIEKAIANNYQIPEYLMCESAEQSNKKKRMKNGNNNAPMPYTMDGIRKGAIMVAIGLGILFLFHGFVGRIGFIVIFIGAAKIIIDILEQRNYKQSLAQNNWNRPSEPETTEEAKAEPQSGSCPPPFPMEDNKENETKE